MTMAGGFIIEAQRVILRPARMEDSPAILAAMECPMIREMHSGGFDGLLAVQSYVGVLLREYEAEKYRTLAVAEKTTDELYGMVTLDVERYFPRAELGYWLSIPYRNKGYMSEAVGAVIKYCFETLGLARVQAVHNPKNPASGRVMQTAGMTFECLLRSYQGFGEDRLLYAAIRE